MYFFQANTHPSGASRHTELHSCPIVILSEEYSHFVADGSCKRRWNLFHNVTHDKLLDVELDKVIICLPSQVNIRGFSFGFLTLNMIKSFLNRFVFLNLTSACVYLGTFLTSLRISALHLTNISATTGSRVWATFRGRC